MATDFNNKAMLGKPVYVGNASVNDLPLDIRTRIDTIDEVEMITFPYVGMMFYVRDKDKFYIVKSLKGAEMRPGVVATYVDNYKIDTYEELNITSVAEGGSGGGNNLIDEESAQKLLGLLEKEESGEFTCDCPFNYDSAKKILEILYDISNGGVESSKVDELKDLLQIQFP